MFCLGRNATGQPPWFLHGQEPLEFLLPDMRSVAVAAAGVGRDEDLACIGVARDPDLLPPSTDRGGREDGRVGGDADAHEAVVGHHAVAAVRDRLADRVVGER